MVLFKEDDVKAFFKKYMIDRKIEFKQEVDFGDCIIDFIAKFNGKWVGVEVKGENNNIFLTLGQLVNYNKFISHLYLCAPSTFIERFMGTYTEVDGFKDFRGALGVIEFDGASVHVIKEPSIREHYLKLQEGTAKKTIKQRFPRESAELDDIDKTILNFLKTKDASTIWDIIKANGFDERYKNSYATICKRLENLEHFGHIKMINKHPKTVSVVSK